MTENKDTFPEKAHDQDTPQESKLKKTVFAGLRLTGTALKKIISRTLWWAGWGAVTGLLLVLIYYFCGWLASPWPAWSIVVTLTLFILYPVAGLLCLGFAGFYRGVGRFVIHLAIDEEWLRMILEKILSKFAELISKSESMSSKMERSQVWLENLPLEKWEQLIKSVVKKVMLVDRPQDAGLISGVVYRYLGENVEFYLLKIVRKEVYEGGGGGICLQRLQEVCLDTADDFFVDSTEGMMNKYLLLMSALLLLISAIAPVSFHFLSG